jgi:hypothetical protein
MDEFLERLMGLWTEPIGTDEAARASFGSIYADPVEVNGTDITLAQLIARARMVQSAFAETTV